MKQPHQPRIFDEHNVERFQQNGIVRKLLDFATEHGFGMNEIILSGCDKDDYIQLVQLIGYSVSGFVELDVSAADYAAATALVPADAKDAYARGFEAGQQGERTRILRLIEDK